MGAATNTDMVAQAGTWEDTRGKFLLLATEPERQFCTPDACCEGPSPAAQTTEETVHGGLTTARRVMVANLPG